MMAVARMTLNTELPRAATMPMASTKSGKAMIVSLMRDTTRSVQPPKTPAQAPARLPTAKDRATAEKAMAMSSRVATMTRLSMSRPSWSVPNQCRAEGGLSVFAVSLLSGS